MAGVERLDFTHFSSFQTLEIPSSAESSHGGNEAKTLRGTHRTASGAMGWRGCGILPQFLLELPGSPVMSQLRQDALSLPKFWCSHDV